MKRCVSQKICLASTDQYNDLRRLLIIWPKRLNSTAINGFCKRKQASEFLVFNLTFILDYCVLLHGEVVPRVFNKDLPACDSTSRHCEAQPVRRHSSCVFVKKRFFIVRAGGFIFYNGKHSSQHTCGGADAQGSSCSHSRDSEGRMIKQDDLEGVERWFYRWWTVRCLTIAVFVQCIRHI